MTPRTRPSRPARPSRAAHAVLAPVAELSTETQVAALLHPIRRRILAALAQPASPAEVARQLGIPAQVANYHVHALATAGLARRVETLRKRNLLEHRFRAIARSFTLSTSLPLTEDQRRRLQSDVTLQQLIRTGDTIRTDALRLLDTTPEDAARQAGAPTTPAAHAAASIEMEVDLPTDVDRAAFVRAVTDAIQTATAAYRRPQRRRTAPASTPTTYRMHLAIYPSPPTSETRD